MTGYAGPRQMMVFGVALALIALISIGYLLYPLIHPQKTHFIEHRPKPEEVGLYINYCREAKAEKDEELISICDKRAGAVLAIAAEAKDCWAIESAVGVFPSSARLNELVALCRKEEGLK